MFYNMLIKAYCQHVFFNFTLMEKIARYYGSLIGETLQREDGISITVFGVTYNEKRSTVRVKVFGNAFPFTFLILQDIKKLSEYKPIKKRRRLWKRKNK